MKRGRIKKIEIEEGNTAYYENIGSYFELALRSFGECFKTRTYSSQKAQALGTNSLKTEVESNLFTIPPNWIWCTIGDVVEVVRNLTIEAELSSDTLINYVDIDAIDNKRYRVREIKKKQVKELSSRARRVLKKGNVIYSLVRPYLNNLAIIEEEKENLIGSTGFAAFKCINVNNEYTKLWLLTPFIRQRYLKYMSGFNSPGISSGLFYSTPIPLPPIEEQVEIVALIKAFENDDFSGINPSGLDLIVSRVYQVHKCQESCLHLKDELTHQLSLVKQLRQAFLREAMQGKLVPQDHNDEPASELLKKIKAEKEQLIKEKKIKKEKELPPIKPEEIPFEIPKSWMWCRLGNVGWLKRGKSKHRPRNDESLFSNGIYPFIQTGDVSKAKYNNDLITTVNDYYNEFGLKQSEIQKKGTLCITIAANIAECGFLGFDACVPDSIVCFLANSKVVEKYTYYFIKTAKEELERFAPATAQKNINLGILNDLVFPLAPLPEQQRIVTKLEQLMNYCDELEYSIKQSQTQNKLVLQQVLREALQPNKTFEPREVLSIVAEQ
jgi:type I restriction enzyme S subunit